MTMQALSTAFRRSAFNVVRTNRLVLARRTFATKRPRSPRVFQDPKPKSKPEAKPENRAFSEDYLGPGSDQIPGEHYTYLAARGGNKIADARYNESLWAIGGIFLACTGIFMLYTERRPKTLLELDGREPPLLDKMAGKGFLLKHMVLSRENIAEGRYYTVLTSSLTHLADYHLVLNMVSLWSFGPTLIQSWGLRPFATLWIGGCLSGAVLDLWLQKPKHSSDGTTVPQVSLGASCALSAMLSSVAVVAPQKKFMLLFFIPVRCWAAVSGFALLSLAAWDQRIFPGVGHLGHLGGLVYGAAYAVVKFRVYRYYGFLRWMR